LEMVGKDVERLQELIEKLDKLVEEEKKKEEQKDKDENIITNDILDKNKLNEV